MNVPSTLRKLIAAFVIITGFALPAKATTPTELSLLVSRLRTFGEVPSEALRTLTQFEQTNPTGTLAFTPAQQRDVLALLTERLQKDPATASRVPELNQKYIALLRRTEEFDDIVASQMLKTASTVASSAPDVSASYLTVLGPKITFEQKSAAWIFENPKNMPLFLHALATRPELIVRFEVAVGLSHAKEIITFYEKNPPSLYGLSHVLDTTGGKALSYGMRKSISEIASDPLNKKTLVELVSTTKKLMQASDQFPDARAPWLNELVERTFNATAGQVEGLSDLERSRMRVALLNAPKTNADRIRFVPYASAFYGDTSPAIQSALARYKTLAPSVSCIDDLFTRIGFKLKPPTK